MDSVRFGRALGIGARLAAKTLVTAVDAAIAPNPSPAQSRAASHPASQVVPQPASQATPQYSFSPSTPQPASAAQRTGQSAARIPLNLRDTTQGVARGTRRFRDATWGPVVKLSGVLWLEFTGVFFGIFALFAAGGAWKLRDNLHRTATNADGRIHFELAAAMAIVFGYFCLSSFLRAHRRSRRS